jgi:hypothetical protein
MLTQRGQVLTGLARQQLGRMPLTRIERPQPHKQVARAILGQLRRIELQRLKDAQRQGKALDHPAMQSRAHGRLLGQPRQRRRTLIAEGRRRRYHRSSQGHRPVPTSR